MTGGIRIDHYDWSRPDGTTGREAVLRFGDDAPRVVLALPLFEGYNRTRAFGVTLLRDLATCGIGGLLPDWPATGESLMPTSAASLAAMRTAYAAITQSCGSVFAIAIRSGALIDAAAAVQGRWHFAPQPGAELVRELARQTSDEGDIAGNLVSRDMLDELDVATTAKARIVRLESDPRDADLKLAGAPLWRRAEPGNDPVLAAALANDIASWIATCAD